MLPIGKSRKRTYRSFLYPWAKVSPPPGFANKVLLEHRPPPCTQGMLGNVVLGWLTPSQGDLPTMSGETQRFGGLVAVTCHKQLVYCYLWLLILFQLLLFSNAISQLQKWDPVRYICLLMQGYSYQAAELGLEQNSLGLWPSLGAQRKNQKFLLWAFLL